MSRKYAHSRSIKSLQQVAGDYASTKPARRGSISKLSPNLLTLKYGTESVRMEREAAQRQALRTQGQTPEFWYPVFIPGVGTFLLITLDGVCAAQTAYSRHYPGKPIPAIRQIGTQVVCGDVRVSPALEPYSQA